MHCFFDVFPLKLECLPVSLNWRKRQTRRKMIESSAAYSHYPLELSISVFGVTCMRLAYEQKVPVQLAFTTLACLWMKQCQGAVLHRGGTFLCKGHLLILIDVERQWKRGNKGSYPNLWFSCCLTVDVVWLSAAISRHYPTITCPVVCKCCNMTFQIDVPRGYQQVLVKCLMKCKSGTFVAQS